MNSNLTMTAPSEVYKKRRAKLAANLRRPMVILAGRAPARTYPGNDYPFRAASTYLYFGGPPIESAAWLIEPRSDGDNGCTLFRPVFGFDEIVWIGEAASDNDIAAAAGLSQSHLAPPDQLAARLKGRKTATIFAAGPTSFDDAAAPLLGDADPSEMLVIVEMRLLKDEHELAAMRRAAKISIDAHAAVRDAAAPGKRETELAAAFYAVLVANNCKPSFTPAVTVRGQVLHTLGYPNTAARGDLLLVDAGAEEPGGYACDITRTYPVGGKFNEIQRHLYDTVLRAQRDAVAACLPGRRFRDVHDLAAGTICAGLVDAGLLNGDPDDLVARRAHTLFFTHGLGHLIGLDVHDMEDFGDLAGYPAGRNRRPDFGDKFLRLDRDLQPGMALTVEPGLYVVPALWSNADLLAPFADVVNRPAVDKLVADHFGGIRLEDTVVVTRSTPEVLTANLPIDGVEVTRTMHKS